MKRRKRIFVRRKSKRHSAGGRVTAAIVPTLALVVFAATMAVGLG